MIKNDRQYRVTRGQLKLFVDSLEALKNESQPRVEPGLVDVHRHAVESQVDELKAELQEYEALSTGKVKHFTVESFDGLPTVLIRARIARGFTQKQFAERLGLKEQQVQRWEANDYAGASIETLKRVVEALGIEIRKEFFVPDDQLQPRRFLRNLESAGIPQELTLRKLLPPNLAIAFEKPETYGTGFREIVQASSLMSRVFSLPLPELLNPSPPKLDFGAVAATLFKMPASASASTVNAYTLYAHYLAAVLASSVHERPKCKLLRDWHKFHSALTSPDNPMTLTKALHFAWDCGILILPLRDSGAFHGAVWRIGERFVIALKQVTPLSSRWLYDLLHEIAHIACEHVSDGTALLEDKEISPEKRNEKTEDEANEWAEDALFDGESEQIEQACVAASEGKLQKLKAVLPDIARRFNVDLGALANYMAYRLAAQGENWWGAANNLQLSSTADPFDEARGILLQRANFHRLTPSDRELLMRALTEE